MAQPRIAIAGFQHETNTFAPVGTGFDAFLDGGGWPGLTFGDDVRRVFSGLNIPLGGFLDASDGAADVVPILWTSAEPAAVVARDAFERIMAMILDGITHAGNLDGIYLDLHGAMVTEDHPDGEAEILRRVRAIAGDLPLAVSLDLHANLSAHIVELADVITIYRTYPHLDMGETGARAWALLREMIATGTRPAKAFRAVPNLIPLSAQCTDFGPLNAFYDSVAARPDAALISADVALGFPLADTSVTGPSVVAYASDQCSADRHADYLAQMLCQSIPEIDNTLLAAPDAVARAAAMTANGGTVVLADVQDNSGAGAMADTTGLLAALVESRARGCLLGTLCDPEAAQTAHQAGVGATLSLTIGGRSGPMGVVPFECSATVLRLSDGRFTCAGEMQRGVATDIGCSALLKITDGGADVTLLISSLRHQSIDQEVFRHLGAEPSRYRIVGVKSTVHFRADFTPIAKAVLMVEAPGYSGCRPENLAYRKRKSGNIVA